MSACFSRQFSLLLTALVFAPMVRAQDYKVETFEAPAPTELAAEVRETLSNAGLRVVGPEGPLCEIWLRSGVPGKADASQRMGVAYPQFEEGTLFGAVRFLKPTKDYRRQTVKPGVYTLRYALHPVDGNHMGVAPGRDFLLLLPAAADANTANLTKVETVNLSKKAIGLNHPSVWSLQTSSGEHPNLPALEHREEENLWVLYFCVPVQAASGGPAPLIMALVVVGSAPEA